MAEEKLMTIDPNIAEENELMQLPGIGPALAKRIIAARPFVDADDMQRVPGLGTTNLERIKLFLDLAPRQLAKEIAQIDQAPEASGIADGLQEEQPQAHITPEEDQKVHLPEEEQRLEPMEPKSAGPQKALQKLHALREATPGPDPGPGKKPFSRGEAVWIMVGISILAMLFSVLINLSILAGINGTLDFNRLRAIQELDVHLNVLDAKVGTFSSNLQSLEQRLKALEGLSGRMTTVEGQVASLQGDMEQALGTVENMQQEIERLSDETTRLTGRVSTFDSFLEGLNRLLGELFASASPSASPDIEE